MTGRSSDGSSVHLAYASESLGRPPLVRLYFDTTLVNAAAGPRWFALPVTAGATAQPPGRGVTGVTPFQLTGERGSAILLWFLGTGAVQALLVPAGGTIRIRHLEIDLWGDRPVAPIPIAVTVARDLRVGDQPIRGWLPVDPEGDRSADVDRTETLRSYNSPDTREQPLVFVDATVISTSVALPRRANLEPGP